MPDSLNGNHFHVSSALNRDLIAQHGLDWTRMGAARGIAGSTRPEVAGVFICRHDGDVQFFLRMNNTGGPVDLWSVDGVDEALLIDNGSGFFYLPDRIPVARIRLVQKDVSVQAARPPSAQSTSAGSATSAVAIRWKPNRP